MPGYDICPICYMTDGEFAPCRCEKSLPLPAPPKKRLSALPYARPLDARPPGTTGLARRLNLLHDPSTLPRSFPGSLPAQNSGVAFHDIFAGINLSDQHKQLSAQGLICHNCHIVFPDFPALQKHIPFCRTGQ